MVVSVSPIVAFLISGFSLSLHRDFYKIDVDELGYDDKDPRWIGAWWLGYFIYAGLMGLISIPYFFFPKEWPKKDPALEQNTSKENEKSEQIKDLVNEDEDASATELFLVKPVLATPGTSFMELVRGYFSTMHRLCVNMTYMAIVLASVSDASMFVGLFSFMGRYLLTQYDVTPAMTAVLLGCATTPAIFIGNFVTGLVLKRLKLGMKGLCRVVVIISCITLATTSMFFLVGCETSPIAGINFPYGGGDAEMDQFDVPPSCSADCHCVQGTYNPVCGEDGITYITPCHAGCTDFSESEGKIEYTNCGCILSDTTSSIILGNHSNSNITAVPEKCPSDCSSRKYGFLFLVAFVMLMYSCASIPGFMLFMRCVDLQDRSVGIGLSSLLGRVLAYIPAPIFFGAAIQTTCLMFQEACGRTGNCFIYDNMRLTYVLFGLMICFKFVALLMHVMSYLSLRKDENGEYQAYKLCVESTGNELGNFEPLKDDTSKV